MKLFIIVFLLLLVSAILAWLFWYQPKFRNNPTGNIFAFKKKEDQSSRVALLQVKQKADHLRAYINRHNYNSDHCFLIDMKLRSGKNRFFVYNLKNDSLELAGLVTHGSGSATAREELSFSNTPNSNCTSLGKYKVGRSYMGKFGLAYKLHGLDNSNNKAYERFVVLHAHSCVPNEEISPLPICESWGCPTVAPAFLNKLKGYIDTSPNPVLLVIYY